METARRDARGRFKPGCSGNPAGKQPGTLNRATRLRRWLDDADEEQAARALSRRAGEGNVTALRILFDRLDPKPKPRAEPVALALPDGASVVQRLEAVFAAMAAGTLNAEEGLQLARFLDTFTTIAERHEAAARAAAEAAQRKAEWQAYVERRDAAERARKTADAKATVEARSTAIARVFADAIAADRAEAAAKAKARAEAKRARSAPAGGARSGAAHPAATAAPEAKALHPTSISREGSGARGGARLRSRARLNT